MGDDIEYRAIASDDYWRAYAVLQALERHREQPEVTVWEHLVALHEDDLGERLDVDIEDLLGDTGFAVEFHRSLILLERLGNDEATVPAEVGAMIRFCATEDCTNHTPALYCPACEFNRRAGPC